MARRQRQRQQQQQQRVLLDNYPDADVYPGVTHFPAGLESIRDVLMDGGNPGVHGNVGWQGLLQQPLPPGAAGGAVMRERFNYVFGDFDPLYGFLDGFSRYIVALDRDLHSGLYMRDFRVMVPRLLPEQCKIELLRLDHGVLATINCQDGDMWECSARLTRWGDPVRMYGADWQVGHFEQMARAASALILAALIKCENVLRARINLPANRHLRARTAPVPLRLPAPGARNAALFYTYNALRNCIISCTLFTANNSEVRFRLPAFRLPHLMNVGDLVNEIRDQIQDFIVNNESGFINDWFQHGGADAPENYLENMVFVRCTLTFTWRAGRRMRLRQPPPFREPANLVAPNQDIFVIRPDPQAPQQPAPPAPQQQAGDMDLEGGDMVVQSGEVNVPLRGNFPQPRFLPSGLTAALRGMINSNRSSSSNSNRRNVNQNARSRNAQQAAGAQAEALRIQAATARVQLPQRSGPLFAQQRIDAAEAKRASEGKDASGREVKVRTTADYRVLQDARRRQALDNLANQNEQVRTRAQQQSIQRLQNAADEAAPRPADDWFDNSRNPLFDNVDLPGPAAAPVDLWGEEQDNKVDGIFLPPLSPLSPSQAPDDDDDGWMSYRDLLRGHTPHFEKGYNGVSLSRSIITVKNTGRSDCVAQCLALLRVWKKYEQTRIRDNAALKSSQAYKSWMKLRRPTDRNNRQRFGRALSVEAGFQDPDVPRRFSDLIQFAQALGHDIVVFSKSLGTPVVFITQLFELKPPEEGCRCWDAARGLQEELPWTQIFSSLDVLYCLMLDVAFTGVDHVMHVNAVHKPLAFVGKFCPKCAKRYQQKHTLCAARCRYCNCHECDGPQEAFQNLKNHRQFQDTIAHAPNDPWLRDLHTHDPSIPLLHKNFDDYFKVCTTCGKKFPSRACFENHLKNNCAAAWRCNHEACGGRIFTYPHTNNLKGVFPADFVGCLEPGQKRHAHGAITFCMKCQDWKAPGKPHFCLIRAQSAQKPQNRVFYCDFECYVESGSQQHVVNFAVVQEVLWTAPLGVDGMSDDESEEEQIHYARTVGLTEEFTSLDDFCTWLFQAKNLGVIVVFHNGRSYDAHFVYRWLLNQNDVWCVSITRTGNKISRLSASLKRKARTKTITLIDSLSFLPFSLARLARANQIIDKGYFPHKFNQPEHQTYEGPIPDHSFFYESSLEFKRWHDHQVSTSYTWNFQNEMQRYCKNDVAILRQVMEKLRESVYDSLGIDPLHVTTLAGLSSKIFFTSFYTEGDPITYLSVKETNFLRQAMFGGRTNAIKLYSAINAVESPFICCGPCDEYVKAKAQGEEQWTIDYSNPENNWGSLCQKCVLKNRGRAITGQSFCLNCEASPETRHALALMTTPPVISLPQCEKKGVKIGYFDVTSLYPFVLCSKRFPTGVPEVFETKQLKEQKTRYWKKKFVTHIQADELAVLECKVVPPKRLYFPVLPSHGKDSPFICEENAKKLLFHLFPTKGVWTSVELGEAVRQGYKIKKITRVLFWNANNTSNEIFQSYICHFLRLKTLANGTKKILQTWRSSLTPEAREALEDLNEPQQWKEFAEAYDTYYSELCGRPIPPEFRMEKDFSRVRPERDEVGYIIAKLFLNSLWGRFSMRNDFTNYQLFNSSSLLEKQAFQKAVVDNPYAPFYAVSEKFFEMAIKEENPEKRRIPPLTNVAIGVFTTSHARLVLLKAMTALGPDVLYHDTDSIVFKYYDNAFPDVFECGGFLGQWTNELDAGEHIVEFASAGPKNYVLKTNHGHKSMKVKGFNVRQQNVKKTLTFDRFIHGVQSVRVDIEAEDPDSEDEQAPKRQKIDPLKIDLGSIIKRQKAGVIINCPTHKSWRVCYTKRKIVPTSSNEIDTVPFGWVD